ncbi:MAG: sugar phosphate nucleotidyltransferase [Patescibacteria group bacterium]|jgi:glucose-1-phosphate thymidylyltransferase
MKGVILAGGTATRLRPLTLVTNKHLLPIFDRPMIYFPLEAMSKAGIKEVLLITGAGHLQSFKDLMAKGDNFGLKISYKIQKQAGGLSQAVQLASSFAGNQKILVILGDNIFKYNLKQAVKDFSGQKKGAKIFAKQMPNCNQYGVVQINKLGKVISIEEKPKKPKSNLAQTGIYMYDSQVFKLIKKLKPSSRGELEITDLNNMYVKQGTMTCQVMTDWWVDAGTSFEELLRANQLVAKELNKSKK